MTVEHTPSPYGPRDGGNSGTRSYAEPYWQDEPFAPEVQDVDVSDLLLAMSELTERQRFVVECRFGLRHGAEGQALSLREIAKLLGVHFTVVAEHERAGLAKLRALLATTAPPTS